MSPLRYKVLNEAGDEARDPEENELPHIQAYVGRYVGEQGVEPISTHEVPGIPTLVWFQHIDN
jgi:hypothetical protein